MLFAHLKRILRTGRLRLRGPRGAQDEFTLGAVAQNLRRLASSSTAAGSRAVSCVINASCRSPVIKRTAAPNGRMIRVRFKMTQRDPTTKIADFCNKTGQKQTNRSAAKYRPNGQAAFLA
jgi:hypothetical protein